VAVIVCTYRRPDRLRAAVAQVLEQDIGGRQFVVVVDDASCDGTTSLVIDELSTGAPERVVAIRHEVNQGAVAARNSGLQAAFVHGAKLVCFHDDDDWWLPGRLRLGLEAVERDLPGGVRVMLSMGEQVQVSERIHRDATVEPIWSDRTLRYWPALIRALVKGSIHIPFQTCLFRTELAQLVGGFRSFEASGTVDEDLDFALRALRLIQREPNWKAVVVPEVLAYHVVSSDSLSARPAAIVLRRSVQKLMLAEHLPRLVVNGAFFFAHRVTRPALARLRSVRRRGLRAS
jgi:glycosyltransferase involved in cell wall biosynthesis